MARYSSTCSCGAVQCEIDCELETIVNCHCTDCRKMSGGAFSTMVLSPESAGRVARGAEAIGRYALSEAVTKHFCTRCGSPLFNTNARLPGLRMLYLGTIDQHERLAPSLNVYCRSKLGWVDRMAELPSHASVPGGGA
jgi:hypothetical protein